MKQQGRPGCACLGWRPRRSQRKAASRSRKVPGVPLAVKGSVRLPRGRQAQPGRGPGGTVTARLG